MQVRFDVGGFWEKSWVAEARFVCALINVCFLVFVDIKTTEIPHGPAHRMNCPKSSGPFLLFVLPSLSSFRSGTAHTPHAFMFSNKLTAHRLILILCEKSQQVSHVGWICSLYVEHLDT